VHAWWPDTPGRVVAVRFEWSPGRLDARYLANRSAFDVAFELELAGGERGVLGVETKYHEHAAREGAPKKDRMDRYRQVTEKSGAFVDGAPDAISNTDLQQIWLDHLLALSMTQADWDWARFVLVHPAANTSFADAAARYRKLLTDDQTFATTTVEQLLDTADALPTGLVAAFRERYLP
jgi:hypothetical protein